MLAYAKKAEDREKNRNISNHEGWEEGKSTYTLMVISYNITEGRLRIEINAYQRRGGRNV